MIISPGRRYIFVHIPKTGGTSMALALEARAMKDDILIGDTPKARRRRRRLDGVKTAGRLWKHATLADAMGLITPDMLEEFFLFTLVRNPWDRMVSYYHWLRDQGFDHPAVALARSLPFDGFLRHDQTRRSIAAHPYGSYLRGPDGGERAAHFLRLEALEQDLAPLEAHLGFRPELPHANASARQADYRGYYSDETAAIVGDICAEDIARFGYAFGA